MSRLEDFKIKIEDAQTIDKSNQQLDKMDKVTGEKGYVSRAPQKPKILRKGQIHAWVQQHVREYLLDEAYRRRVQQGVIVEEALELYYQKQGNKVTTPTAQPNQEG